MTNRPNRSNSVTLKEINESLRLFIADLEKQTSAAEPLPVQAPPHHKGAIERAHQLVEAAFSKLHSNKGGRRG